MNTLKHLNDNTSRNIHSLLETNKNIKISTKDLVYFLDLYRSHPSLFRALSNKIYSTTKTVKDSEIFKHFGIKSQILVPDFAFDKQMIQNLKKNDENKIIQSYISTSAFESLKTFQHLYSEANDFANTKNSSDDELSLINTSYLHNFHFADILLNKCLDSFKANQFDEGIKALSILPSLKDWATLLYIANESKSTSFLSLLFSSVEISDEENAANNILKRIRNDCDLFRKIKASTGQITDSEQLSIHSLPYVLLSYLKSGNSSPFEELELVEHFCMTDNDVINDNNFVWSYFALFLTLNAVSSQNNLTEIEEIVQNIEKCFNNITENTVLNRVAEDIFSALFITDEDGNFVYRASAVTRIIQTIVPYADNQLQKKLSASLRKLQISQLVEHDDSLLTAMTDQKTALFAAIKHEQWATAKVVVTKSPYLAPILEEFTEMKNISKGLRALDDKKDTESIRINASLSLQTMEEELRKTAEKDNEAGKIAKRRLDQSNLTLQIDKQKLNQIEKQIENLEADSWKCIPSDSFNGTLFNKYIEDINFKAQTLLGKEEFKTVGKVISVSTPFFVKTLIKEFNREEINKQAKSMGLDIVELVFSVRDSIDNETLFSFLDSDKEALLAAKIEANVVPEDASDVITKFVQRSIKKKQNKEVNKMDPKELSEYLEEKDSSEENGCDATILKEVLKRALDFCRETSDIIIDISYRLECEEFKKVVEEKLQTAKINEINEVIKDCNCCEELVSSVSLLSKVESKGIRPFPLKVALSKLISTQENFEIAQEFCNTFRYKIDVKGILREGCLKALRKSEPIHWILNICPPLSKEILMSIPERYKAQTAKEDLSEETQNSDIISLIINCIDDVNAVKEIYSKNPEINSDKVFYSYMEQLIQKGLSAKVVIKSIANAVKVFSAVFKKFENIISASSKIMFQYINQINVTSDEEELHANTIIKQLYTAFNEFYIILLHFQGSSSLKSSLNEAISYTGIMRKFSDCNIFSRYHEPYSFNKYTTKETVHKLITQCFKFDFVDIAQSFINVWKVPHPQEAQDYAILCYSLGQIKSIVSIQDNYRRRNSQNAVEGSKNFRERIVDIFTHRSVYDNGFIQTLCDQKYPLQIDQFMAEFLDTEAVRENIKQPRIVKSSIRKTTKRMNLSSAKQGSRVSFFIAPKPKDEIPEIVSEFEYGTPQFYYRLKAICKYRFESSTKESREKMLRYLLKNYSSTVDQTYYLASQGLFEKAFKCMKMSANIQQKWFIFIGGIFPATISYSLLPRMKQFIINDDADMKFYGSYFEKLLQVAMKNGMNSLKFEMQSFLNRNDEAAYTAVQIFLESTNPYKELRQLTVAQQALQTEIQSREKKTKKTPEFLSDQQISSISRGIVLQQLFVRFCIDENISIGTEYNLFKSKSHALLMSVLLFKSYQYALGVEIMRYSRVPPQEVASKIIDIFVNEREETVINFINELNKFVDVETFETIVTTMLMRLSFVLHNQKLVEAITRKCVKTPDYKCRLFIQFNQLESALSVAKSSGLTHMLPLIGNLALKSNLVLVAQEAAKLLSHC